MLTTDLIFLREYASNFGANTLHYITLYTVIMMFPLGLHQSLRHYTTRMRHSPKAGSMLNRRRR